MKRERESRRDTPLTQAQIAFSRARDSLGPTREADMQVAITKWKGDSLALYQFDQGLSVHAYQVVLRLKLPRFAGDGPEVWRNVRGCIATVALHPIFLFA